MSSQEGETELRKIKVPWLVHWVRERVLECPYCHHRWKPRGNDVPKSCPKCKVGTRAYPFPKRGPQ